MVSAIIIPIAIVGILGIAGYLIYKFLIFDFLCNRSVNDTLKKYDIRKTQFQIIKDYQNQQGILSSDSEIFRLAKQYRQKEPEQFLAMYDSTREKSKS